MSNSVREETMATAEQAQVTEKATDEVVNTVVDAEASVAPKRYFTIPGLDPFDEIEWELRDAHIPGKDGPRSSRRTSSSRSSGRRPRRTSSRRSTSAAAWPRPSASAPSSR